MITSRDREKRDLTIQYDESALAFAHRLMEEEGLSYYFEHDEEGPERLVIVDENEHFPAVEVEGDHVPFVPVEGNDHEGAEPVIELRADERVGTTDVVLTDYDWTRVSRAITAEDRSEPSTEPVVRESHEAHGGVHHARYDADGRAYGTDDVAIQAALRAEAYRMERRTFRGRALAIGFAPGRVFELLGHPVSAFDREHLLVEVTHRGRNPRFAERTAGESERHLEYECAFLCIPSDVPHRPARTTPKPRVHGVHAALVVGPAGEEIWCDEHGRIHVRFAWDRLDQQGEERTCWVRCMQSWAGGGFGTLFIPRIGMEVVVAFVGGDPDKPLVTGCVYNGLQTPPYPLPEHKTRSTLRTQSSPSDSHGYNELRFEDKAGSEEVFIHAQKDLNEVVEHDHSTRVKRNQSNTVDGDQTERVGGDQSMTVAGARTATIDMNELVTIRKAQTTHVGADHEHTVAQNQTLTTAGSRDLFVGKRANDFFHGGRDTVVEAFENLHVLNANQNVQVDQQHNVTAGEHVSMRVGSTSELFMKAGILVKGQDRVKLESGDSYVEVTPSTVTIDAVSELKLRCGNSSITLSPSGVTIEAPEVTLTADPTSFVKVAPGSVQTQAMTGTVAIDGLMVRIN